MTTHVRARDIFRFAGHYWRQVWKSLTIVVALLLINTILTNILVPSYLRNMVNTVSMAPHAGDLWLVVQHYFIMFSLAFLIGTLLWGVALIIWNAAAARCLHTIVNDALYKVQRFSADWHANTFAGGTVRKITRGMWSFDRFEDVIFLNFCVVAFVSICTLVTLVIHVPYVALYLFLFIVLYTALSLWASVKILMPYYRRAASGDTAVGATLADIMTGMPTVKSFASEDREDKLFRRVTDEWIEHSLTSWQTARYIDSLRSIMRIALFSGMVFITLVQWAHGQATPGDLALVITCYFGINNFLRDLGTMINDIQRSMSEMEDVVSFWMQDIEVKDIPHAKDLVVGKQGGEIVFDRVKFQYKNTSAPIYEDLNVTIRAGEKVALVGMSGSGKSTMVKLLQRLYDVTGGEVRIDGQDISKVTQTSLRAQVALVPQDPILFHRTLAENISYARPGASFAEIENAARLAYAHDFIMSFPNGYETLVGERGVKLSGGERQRVAVARAILAGTPILVMDEATSSLDSISEYYIQKGLENLMEGRTSITIAHRLATIRAADRILVFSDGKIVEEGRHDDLIARPESLYKKLYDMQALGLHE